MVRLCVNICFETGKHKKNGYGYIRNVFPCIFHHSTLQHMCLKKINIGENQGNIKTDFFFFYTMIRIRSKVSIHMPQVR